MYHTVTLNPSIDYLVNVPDYEMGRTNRAHSERFRIGGKGINVSFALKEMGEESIAHGFAGGFTGKEILKKLEAAGISHDFICIEKGLSRINIKLMNDDGTEINGCGPDISDSESRELLERLKGIEAGDVLFLCGSIPGTLPDDYYGKIMTYLQGKGITFVVDTSGKPLKKVLPLRPFLIKPNLDELGNLFGKRFCTRDEIIEHGKLLRKAGARNVLISMGARGAILLAETGQIYAADALQGDVVSSVGAGDAMIAGFMVSWNRSGDYEKALESGIRMGCTVAFRKII